MYALGLASLFASLAASGCTPSTAGVKPQVEERVERRAEEPPIVRQNFSTPEETIKLYIERVAANDVAGALRAYDADEQAARFDFAARVSFAHFFSLGINQAPSEYPLFRELNQVHRRAELAGFTKAFVYNLLTDRDPRGSEKMQSNDEIQAFVQAVNPARLATLKVVRVDRTREFDGDEAQALFKMHASRVGADEVTERIALYDLSGQTFWSGFELCRYDDTWKISGFDAHYGGVPGTALVSKTTAAEYESRLSKTLPPPGATVASVPSRTAEPPAQKVDHSCKRAFADKSLATPEAAVSAYVESITANDCACALQTYAAHEIAARFNLTEVLKWLGVFSPSVLNAPAEYPMFVAMNEVRAKADLADATKLFVYGFLTDKDPTGVQAVQSDDEVQAFVQAVNPARLASLKVVRIDQPRPSVTNGTTVQTFFKETAARDGADEMTDRIALYELAGQSFYSGFRLCRYDQSWKVCDLKSSFGGLYSSDVVGRTTAAKYEALLQ